MPVPWGSASTFRKSEQKASAQYISRGTMLVQTFLFRLTLRTSPDDGPSRERNHTEGRSACLPCAHAHKCLECPRGDGTTALDHPKNRQNESGRETQFNLSHTTASKKRQGWVVCILTLKHTDLSVLCRTC